MYSHDNYIKHRDSIRNAQKRYYEKNKAKYLANYKHHRDAWDAAHKAYLNEHSRLNSYIHKLVSKCAYSNYTAKQLEQAYQNKEYLRQLHARGLI